MRSLKYMRSFKKRPKKKRRRTRNKRLPQSISQTYKVSQIYQDDRFIKCFDENIDKIKKAITRYSGIHSIDPHIAEEFINEQVSDVRKQAARDLIENTIYITLEEVDNIIETLIIKLYTEHNLNAEENIYIYVGQPEKSFYFLSVLALYYILKHNFKEPTYIKRLHDDMFDEIGTSPFIIIDDVSYSGTQLSNMLNHIYYSRVIKKKKDAPNIFVLLLALNDFSKIALEQVPKIIYKNKYILEFEKSPFKLLYNPDRLYTPLLLKVGIERYFYIQIFFSPYIGSVPYISLYLDHKIADAVSTYKTTLLYGQIVPSNYNYIKYFEYVVFMYTIIPSIPNNMNIDMLETLYATFNIDNTDIKLNIDDSHKVSNDKIIEYLCEKLKKIDICKESTQIQFKPFINSCNNNHFLLNIINDENIKNMDYNFFILPSGIFDGKNDVTLQNDLKDYFKNIIDDLTEEDKQQIISNHKLITSYNCPISWYKKGEFEMNCISL